MSIVNVFSRCSLALEYSTAAAYRSDHQPHNGMRACVRNNDGACWEGFEVIQGLCRGCALSPLLFSIFFAAILLITIERFSEDAEMLADLANL